MIYKLENLTRFCPPSLCCTYPPWAASGQPSPPSPLRSPPQCLSVGMCVLYHTLLDTGKWPLESPCAVDSEGGRGKRGGGEFRPNEWKPGMCVGEGGKGGANRGRSPSPSARGRTFGGQKRGGKLCVGRTLFCGVSFSSYFSWPSGARSWSPLTCKRRSGNNESFSLN